MALVNEAFDSVSPDKAPQPVRIEPRGYKGIVVDNAYTPRRNLTAYIAGSKWVVNWYSQVVDTDSGLTTLQVSRPGHVQSYRLIKDLVLKVSSALQDTQQATTGQMALRGSATVLPGTLVPNVGDVFIADIGDGTLGLFEVLLSEKLRTYRDSAYGVDYALRQAVTPEIQADLVKKTVETLYFNRDGFLFGNKPLLHDDELNYYVQLTDLMQTTKELYFRQFFDDESSTLVVPYQQLPTYDPFLVKAIMQFFTTDDHPLLKRVRVLNTARTWGWDTVSIWDSVLNRRMLFDKGVHQHFGLMHVSGFNDLPLTDSIRHSAIRQVVWPDSFKDVVSNNSFKSHQASSSLNAGPGIDDAAISAIASSHQYNLALAGLPFVVPVSLAGPYVLSEGFYKDGVPSSLLEQVVLTHLAEKYADPEVLLGLMKSSLHWGALQQFYYLPLLWMVVRNYYIAAGR